MRLRIKKKWFDKIRYDGKRLEFRDAHITFVCEETGKEMRMAVTSAKVVSRISTEAYFADSVTREEFKELFEDNSQIVFCLKKVT